VARVPFCYYSLMPTSQARLDALKNQRDQAQARLDALKQAKNSGSQLSAADSAALAQLPGTIANLNSQIAALG
jgi:uncharacterized protein involved in exopolysaccharide biosynthesis